jgi:hypothetical protein
MGLWQRLMIALARSEPLKLLAQGFAGWDCAPADDSLGSGPGGSKAPLVPVRLHRSRGTTPGRG